jgi:outer membrane receptor for Fe3+-dicitrate
MIKRNMRIVKSFLLLNLMILPLFGANNGKIAGRVTSATSNEPLVAVNVIVTDEMLGAATDADGYYSILNVPPGTYEILVTSIGYANARFQNIKVNSDMTTTLNVKMESAVLQGEEVVVVAQQPLVKKDLTSSKSTVTEEDLAILPVESSAAVLSTQAGVTTGADGALHVRGGRSSEVIYMIDGIPVSSNLGNSISTNVISELTLISGTFNAEYGKAMSGIVNITTKDGNRDFAANAKVQIGDMYSNNSHVFDYVDEFSPLTFTRTDLDISGPLPLLKNGGYFFTGTWKKSDGWLYGVREHNTYDSYSLVGSEWNIMMTGDSARVPLNTNESVNAMGKLFFSPTDKTKLMYQIAAEESEWQNYDHAWKYNPDGRYQHENQSLFQALHFTHTLSQKTYYTMKFSHSQKYAEDYVHKLDMPFEWNEDINGNGIIDELGRNSDGTSFTEDLDGNGLLELVSVDWDFIRDYGGFIPNPTWYTIGDSISVPRFVYNVGRSDVPSYHFIYGGQQMGYYISQDITSTAKFDLTSQLTRNHQVRMGLEGNLYSYHRNNMAIEMSGRTLYQPYIPSANSSAHDDYTKEPYDVSAYVQDKIELNDFIMNIGLRWDYFNANDYTFSDEQRPAQSDTVMATPKSQISPRLGFSFPITDQGYIHFSYGHFFQMPGFSYLYRNPNLKRVGGVAQFGNPDLDAQKTVMYELGFQQQLSPTTAIDITMFYRDIINWLSTEYNFIDNTFRYTKYVTEDYGNVRGITLAFTQRARSGMSLNLDYTYQMAEGNSSSPDAVYYDNLQIPPIESEKKVVPLSWDVRHSVNGNLTLRVAQNAGISIVSSFTTGRPYTPQIQGQRNAEENSDNKPFQFKTDLQGYYDIVLGSSRFRLALKVYNLFDRLNENYVHDDTGRAGYSLVPTYAGQSITAHQGDKGVHPLEEVIYPPTYYANPRQILVSLSWNFKRNS